MKPRLSAGERGPRWVPDQLVVQHERVELVARRLEQADVGTSVVREVGGFRLLELNWLKDAAGEDLVLYALEVLGDEAARGDEEEPLAEPNYIHGCPQMRGGEFVLPDPLPDVDVSFLPSPIGAGVRITVFDTEYVEIPDVPTAGLPSYPVGTGELPPAAGHATFVVGQILRVAPGATVTAVTLLDEQGECTDTDLADALFALPEVDPPHIVNLSLGGPTLNNRLPGLLRSALVYVQSLNAAVVAAAGNDDTDWKWWPAAATDLAVGVASLVRVDEEWFRAAYSNFGDWVQACAPGHLSGPFLEWVYQPQPYGGWAAWSGTSFSTPIVTGALAALMTMQSTFDPFAALTQLLDNSPIAPAGDFPIAKVVWPPLLWGETA